MYKTLDYWSRDVLNFNFLEKDLGIVSVTNFGCDVSRKMFVMLNYILTDQISLSNCLCILRYWAICVLQLLVSQIVTSTILKLILSF